MSSGGRRERAFPSNSLDRDWTFISDTGGSGGGNICPIVLGQDRTVITVKNSPFMVYNKLAIVEFRLLALPFTDAGPDFFCDHSLGNQLPVWVAIGGDPSMSVDDILAQGNQIPDDWLPGVDPPVVVEYYDKLPSGAKGYIPQPTDPGYDGNTYITLYWGDATAVSDMGIPGGPTDHVTIIKEDYNESI